MEMPGIILNSPAQKCVKLLGALYYIHLFQLMSLCNVCTKQYVGALAAIPFNSSILVPYFHTSSDA